MMIIKKLLMILIIISIANNYTIAQNYIIDYSINSKIEVSKKDTNLNLVPNFSFENYSFCPEGCTIIPKSYFVDDWIMATIGTPDYFNICSTEAGVPNNWAGRIYPKTGNGYTGLIAGMYINDNGKIEEKREYLEAKLKSGLKKNCYYLLGFSASLAGKSKYAINGLGMFLSDTLVDVQDYICHLPFQPQLLNKNNEPIFEKFTWKEIKNIYKATGNEKYIIIGNFQSDDNTKFFETRNYGYLNCSYYFIDDVYLLSLGNEILDSVNNYTNWKKNKSPTIIYFDFDKWKIKPVYYHKLDSTISVLHENSKITIEIAGYTDNIGKEPYNLKLSKKRAKEVAEYFLKNNISSKIISENGFGNNFPIASNNNLKGRAQNRRVEINLCW